MKYTEAYTQFAWNYVPGIEILICHLAEVYGLFSVDGAMVRAPLWPFSGLDLVVVSTTSTSQCLAASLTKLLWCSCSYNV